MCCGEERLRSNRNTWIGISPERESLPGRHETQKNDDMDRLKGSRGNSRLSQENESPSQENTEI